MKRFSLITLLFLTLTHTASVADTFTDSNYPNLLFTVLDPGAKTVSVKGVNNASAGQIIIPDTVNDGVHDYAVTTIAEKGFYSYSKITKVVFPEGLTTIGNRAFAHCTAISDTIILPSSLTSIHSFAAFYNVPTPAFIIKSPTPPTITNPESYGLLPNIPICIPSGTRTDYNNSPEWSKYKQLFCDEQTFTDGKYIYTKLSSNTASASGYVGDLYSIADTVSIKAEVTNPFNNQTYRITEIGSKAFYSCPKITSVQLSENIERIGDKAFAHDSLIVGKLVLPASLREIGEKVFYNLLHLDTLTILSETPPALLDNASQSYNTVLDVFFNLPISTLIQVPCNTLRTYQKHARWGFLRNRYVDPCMVLVRNFYYQATNKGAEVIGFETTPQGEVRFEDTVTINGKNLNVVTITDGFLANNTDITKLTLPTHCTTLGSNSFVKCTNLKKIYLNEGLQTIGDTCFMGGTFDTIVMPSTLKTIGKYSFRDNPNLRGLFLNEGLQSIGERAFTNNSALRDTIIIPSSITQIGAAAFTRCDQLTYVILRGSNPPRVTSDGYPVFGSASEFIVPCGYTEAYKTAPYWKTLKNNITNNCKPLILKQGDILERDTAVSSIAYRRKFDMDVWQTLYLPFDVDSVLVYDEQDAKYYDINYPFKPGYGGYFYLNKYDTTNVEEATITFSTDTTLKGNTHYLIQFPTTDGYFEGKDIVFKSTAGEYTLNPKDYSQPKATKQFQVSGNSSVYNQSVSDMYIFRTTRVTGKDGKDSIKYEFNRQASDTLKPFEFGLLPYVVEPSSGISSAPMRMSLRIGRSSGNTGGGGITTSVSETHASNAITYRTGAGELALSLNGLPCQLYSVSGTLLYSSAGGTEEITIPLEKGIYILYSEGQSQKIVL